MQLNFVIPGHYKTRGLDPTKDSSCEIIRVLGESNINDDFFTLADGREMHEQQILASYDFYNITNQEEIKGKSFVLGDLNKTKSGIQDHEMYYETNPEPNQETNHEPVNNGRVYSVPNYETKVAQKEVDVDSLVENKILTKIFNKLKLNNKKLFSFKIDLKVDVDLYKISDIAELMDISDKEIMKKIIIDNIDDISQYFLDGVKSKQIEPEIKTEPIPEIKTEPIPEIKTEPIPNPEKEYKELSGKYSELLNKYL